jgi:hypothetical protein
MKGPSGIFWAGLVRSFAHSTFAHLPWAFLTAPANSATTAKPDPATAVFGLKGNGNDAETLFQAFPGPDWYRRTVAIPAD